MDEEKQAEKRYYVTDIDDIKLFVEGLSIGFESESLVVIKPIKDWMLLEMRVTELEALSKQAMIAALLSESEWESLSPQSRHRVNVWMGSATELALAVTAYWGPVVGRGKYIEEMARLASLLAPDAPSDTYHIVEQPKIYSGKIGPGGLFADTGDDPVHPHFEPVPCEYDHLALRMDGHSSCPTCGAIPPINPV